MGLWTLITAAFFIQEFATTAVVLVLAQNNNLPLWPIHIIWAGTTIADMYLGYLLGSTLKKHLSDNKFIKKIESWIRKTTEGLGSRGTNLAIMIIGIVNFPYLNAFIGAWFNIPKNNVFFFTFIGNFIWYLILWGTVLGLTSFIHDPNIILLILIAIGVLSHVSFRIFERAKRRRKSRA